MSDARLPISLTISDLPVNTTYWRRRVDE